jgi:ATP-dependent DNA ligase
MTVGSYWRQSKDRVMSKASKASKQSKVSKPMPAPMLAHPYDAAHAKKMPFPCLVQPKLDGVRMVARITCAATVELASRTGKSFAHLLPLFEADLVHASASASAASAASASAASASVLVLDGELYSHGAGFQTVVGMAKNTRTVAAAAGKLRYHVYDLYLPHAPAMPFRARCALLAGLVGKGASSSSLELVEAKACETAEAVRGFLQGYLQQGYEGVMLRDPGSAYALGKRSDGLLKYKLFRDAEYRIVGVDEAGGRDAGTALFVCTNADGRRFRVRPMGTLEQRGAMLHAATELVGKMLTVRFQELTDDGVPRFPVGVAVRDYE